MANIKQQTRQSAAADAAPQHGGTTPDHASKATGNAPMQDGRVVFHVARIPGDLTQQATAQTEEVGRQLTKVVQQAMEGVRTFMALPTAASGGLIEMQQAVAHFAGNVVQANLRLAQGMIQATDPGTIVDLQRRCVREHVSAFTDSSASIIRAARQTADGALRPLEFHLEQRRRGQQGSQQGQQHSRCVADVMSPGVRVANPEDTVQQAARIMREENTGALPVGEDDRLIGMVTDHDIAALVADARDPAHTKVREVMVPEERYIFEDEDPHQAAVNMVEQHVIRLPVVSRGKRLVGVVSLGDLAAEDRDLPPAIHAPGGHTSKNVYGEVAAE